MTQRSPRRKGVRAVLSGALAVGMAAVACDVPAPTQPVPPTAEAVMGSLSERLGAEGAAAERSEQPIIFIDGVRLESGAREKLASLDPSDVARVEIVKGSAAAVVYPSDPQAVHGVIYVFTKRGRSEGR